MKKLAALLLAMLMVFVLAACAGNNTGTDRNTQDSSTAPDNSQAESNNESSKDDGGDAVKVLVAYFSATNTTEGVAKTIADSLGADLYEIIPEQPYTDADLDYHDDKSRSTIEMNDPNARPAISGSVENMDQYDIVFIGYPKMEYLNKSVYSV